MNKFSLNYVIAASILSYLYGFNHPDIYDLIIFNSNMVMKTSIFCIGILCAAFLLRHHSIKVLYRFIACTYIVAGVVGLIVVIIKPLYSQFPAVLFNYSRGLTMIVVLFMLNDMSNPRRRGSHILYFTIMFFVGLATKCILQWLELRFSLDKKFISILTCTVSTLFATIGLGFHLKFCKFHSPFFYMNNRDWESARDVIEKMADTSEEADEIFTDYSEAYNIKCSKYSKNVGLLQMFKSSFYSKLLMLGCILYVIASIENNIYIILILRDLNTILICIILSVILSIYIDRINRKTILVFTLILQLILLVIGKFVNLKSVILLQIISSSLVVNKFVILLPASQIYIIESLPEELRIVFGLTLVLSVIFASVLTLLFPHVQNTSFYILVGISIFALIITCFLRETRNCSESPYLVDIVNHKETIYNSTETDMINSPNEAV